MTSHRTPVPGGAAPSGGPVHPRANLALALGIVGCIPLLTFPGIAALALAGNAERHIWASNGAFTGEDRVKTARRLGRVGIGIGLVTAVLLLVFSQRSGIATVQEVFFNPTHFRKSFPAVAEGFWLNIQMFLIAEALVLVWGLVLAVFRIAPGKIGAPLRWFAIIYIDALRGLPAILTIVLVGLGLPLVELPLFKDFSDFQYAILALTLVYGAYVAEVYRSGIESIHWSQTAAARSLGLSYGQAMQSVIVPQAVRRVIPPLLNDWIGLQKDTALVNILGMFEGFNAARNYNSNHSTLTATTVLGLCYLVVTIPLARFTDWMIVRDQRRMSAGT